MRNLRAVGPEEVARPGPIYSVACSRSSDAGLSLLPVVIARVRKFSTTYGTDDPGGEEMVRSILAHVAAEVPTLFAAAFVRDRRVIGHYVVMIDTWVTKKLVTILQFKLDEAIPLDRVRAEIDALEKWGRTHGCTGFQTMTRNETLARAFRTFYGFRYHATVLRRAFAAEGESTHGSAPAPAEN